jgi:predicted house-cleaning noncanonical NTP pyrophosphatase (MazG superfamily)
MAQVHAEDRIQTDSPLPEGGTNEQNPGLSRLEEIAYPDLKKHLESVTAVDVNRMIQEYSVEQSSLDQEDVDTDFRHKNLRLANKIASQEPTPEVVWSSGTHRGQPISEKELGNLTKTALTEEVRRQACDKATLTLQVKQFMDMINRVDKRKTYYRQAYETSKLVEKKLQKKIEELKEGNRVLRAQSEGRASTRSPTPAFGSSENRQQSLVSSGGTEGKRSAKYPDPPALTNGVDPTFKEWETGLKNKFLFNQDWFEDDQQTRVHAKQVAYIQTTVKGKAFEHLDSFLDQHEEGKVITAEMCRKFLKQVFDDPDKRLKARTELSKLKLKYLGDFNDFYSEFVRLANVSKKPRSEWKEEIHDKLYEELQVHLEQHVMDEDCDFEAYCQKARHFARGQERIGAKRREFANKRKQQPGRTSANNTQQSRGQSTNNTKPAAEAQTFSSPPTCYNCGKTGHLRKDCPLNKSETKAIDPDDSDDYEDFESPVDAENE